MRRLALLALLLLTAAPARADVVFTVPCPFGAQERTSHAGPRCIPWTCESDADCEGGLVCRPWRVCVENHAVPVAGRGAFRQPPPPPTPEDQVVATCAPSQACDGSESPRPPTRGEATGPVRCEVAPHCVRPDLPPIPAAVPESPPASEGAPPEPAQEQRPSDPPGGAGSACGCRAAGASRTAPFGFALALLALAWRRR